METVRKDTTPEMLFQEAIFAIFLKNRYLKGFKFLTRSDKISVGNPQISQKTGFWRWWRTEVGKSEFLGGNRGRCEIDGHTKRELLVQTNDGFAEAVISDIVVR